MRVIKKRRPTIALILSILAPGLGHVYNGQLRKGIIPKNIKEKGNTMRRRSKQKCLASAIRGTFFVVIFILGFITESSCFDHGAGVTGISSNMPSNIQQLTFSSTEHSFERNLVMKHERIRFKTGRIYIALADLNVNDDGIKEIISYIDILDYCGQETGCPLNIYRIVDGKLTSLLMPRFNDGFPMFIEIDKTGKQNVIGILSNTTMGWHDILIGGETAWKWHGKYYDR
jgi:hypothetical protein